jgi:hypothetical protein
MMGLKALSLQKPGASSVLLAPDGAEKDFSPPKLLCANDILSQQQFTMLYPGSKLQARISHRARDTYLIFQPGQDFRHIL